MISTVFRATALASVLLLLAPAIPASAQQPRTGPEGLAFYTPPSPLTKGKPGAVLWTRPLTDAAALPSAGRNLLVLYHSRNIDGRDIAVSGTLAIPAGIAPSGGWPLITWATGTTGMSALCAPSRDTADGPEHAYLSTIHALLDGFVRRGYAVAASDFEGRGTPGLQPFMQGKSAGQGVLDIVRAARQIDPSIGKRYVIMGHSQGGQAELFAAALAPSYLPELQLLGNVAMAPGSHIGQRLKAIVTEAEPSLTLAYVTYLLQSFASNHPDIRLARILTPQALAQLPQTLKECMTKTLSEGYWATATPKDQFIAGADLGPLLKVAAANEPGALRILSPTLLLQGTADVTVPPNGSDAVARGLCDKGAPLFYEVLQDATHNEAMTHGLPDAEAWIDARFAGEKAYSNCHDLPLAGRSARQSVTLKQDRD